MTNSETSEGYSAAVAFMAAAISSTTTLTTNSPVSSMLVKVSLRLSCHPAALREDENTTVGGLYATALKKLYGARLTTPSVEIVENERYGARNNDTREYQVETFERSRIYYHCYCLPVWRLAMRRRLPRIPRVWYDDIISHLRAGLTAGVKLVPPSFNRRSIPAPSP